MEFYDGYDLGFEDGAWYGYSFAIERLKQLRVKREAIIVAGTLAATLAGVKIYSIIKDKSKKPIESLKFTKVIIQ